MSGGAGQCSRGSYGDDQSVLPFLFICERSLRTASAAKVVAAVFFVLIFDLASLISHVDVLVYGDREPDLQLNLASSV